MERLAWADPNNYYNLDDILADAEVLPCIFPNEATDLGFLDEQGMDEQNPAYREMLLADPSNVNLRGSEKGQGFPFFYEFGCKISSLIQSPEVAGLMCRVINVRYQEIVKRTADRKQHESLKFKQGLCNMELQLFHAKAAGLLQLKKLHDRSSVQLGLSPVLAQLKKASMLNAPTAAAAAAAGEAAASTSARISAEETARSGRARHAGVLRNITNAPSSTAAGAASHHPSKASQRPTLPASTLAQLAARNESNRPLASHETMRFGMAATQAREAAAKALENQRGYEATQAATHHTQQQQQMPAATSRKRKSGTNK